MLMQIIKVPAVNITLSLPSSILQATLLLAHNMLLSALIFTSTSFFLVSNLFQPTKPSHLSTIAFPTIIFIIQQVLLSSCRQKLYTLLMSDTAFTMNRHRLPLSPQSVLHPSRLLMLMSPTWQYALNVIPTRQVVIASSRPFASLYES